MSMSIFYINRVMVSNKSFAKLASEQDFYAYSIHALGLKLGLYQNYKLPKKEKLDWLLEEIRKYYKWSYREFSLNRHILVVMLEDQEVTKFWLVRLGAPEKIWKKMGVKMPEFKLKKGVPDASARTEKLF